MNNSVGMKRFMKIVLTICFIAFVFFLIINSYQKFLVSKKNKNSKKLFNIVLVGAAGSGKGTQSELIKNKMNLLQISAGEVLRKYRRDPNAKYTKTINEYIDKGQLVPTEITHEILATYMEKNVFCANCSYNGVIFDGFPRQMEQLKFLDSFLDKHNNKIDAVVHIDIPMEALVDRLSGRYSCSNCGALYHKTSKPTKVPGVCDKCGGTHFDVRADDQNKDAIRARFKIFADTTMPVLEEYKKRNIVIRVDGNKKPDEISKEILTELHKVEQAEKTKK